MLNGNTTVPKLIAIPLQQNVPLLRAISGRREGKSSLVSSLCARIWYTNRVSEILLQTKLNRPEIRPFFVTRPLLMQKLNKSYAGRLTLVTAPAGFGKTTLISHWLDALEESNPKAKTSWFSLDEGDNARSVFLLYLIAALATAVNPQTAPKLQTIKASVGTFAPTDNVQPLLVDLLNTIHQDKSPLTLILDDYHLIENESVHAVMQFIVHQAPANLHLVIMSRMGLPFPIARLQAQGLATRIQADELRFSAEETAVFFQQQQHIQLNDSQLAAIAKQTEGWVACLQLAGLALQTAPFNHKLADGLADLLAHHTDIADYLMEEVLSQQPPVRQQFLLQTAVLDRFSAPLCDAVTSDPGVSQEVIAQLRRDNLFVIPLDVTGEWFRYHHLFSAFLRNQLQRRHPDQVRAINGRAARWFHKNGYHAEAVQQALASGDFAQHADIFSAAATHYLFESNVSSAYDWFAQIPRQIVLENLGLCVNQAWIYLLSGEPETAVPYVATAEALLVDLEPEIEDEAGLRRAKGNIFLMRINLAYEQRAYEFVIKNVPLVEALLDSSAERLRTIAKNLLALTYLNLQQYDAAERELNAAIQLGKRSQNKRSLFVAAAALSQIYRQQGRLRRAKALADEMLLLLAEYPQQTKRYMADAIYSELCRVLYQWNQLDLVVEHLQGSLCLQAQSGYLQDFLTLAQLQKAEGNLALAQETLAGAFAQCSDGSTQQLSILVWQLQLRNQAGQQDAESVQTAVSLSHQLQEQDERTVLQQRVKLLQARHSMATGKRSAALSFLDEVEQYAQALALNGLLLETAILRALANAKDEMETAVSHLTYALKLAQPAGYVRLFVDEGEPMLSLLRQLAEQNVMGETVTQLIANFPTAVETDLTQRELLTLQFFAAGLSAQAIAANMAVSPATIYTYSKRIYRKLGVHNRQDALQKAKNLGLLP